MKHSCAFRRGAGRLIAFTLSALAATTIFAKAEWTIMYYWAGDNDLEKPMMDDLKELMKSGSTEDVELIVLFDRAEGHSRASIGGIRNFTTTKWLRVQKDKLEELEDWGERDTGDAATLTEFMNKTAERFPANRYKLVMNDHGAAWQPCFYDEGGSKDSTLTMDEIRDSLAEFKSKNQKLDILAFDACLMACLETSFTLSEVTKYIIASQEEIPLYGYEYTKSMAEWMESPRLSTQDMALRFARHTDEFFSKSPREDVRMEGADMTISVINTAEVSGLRNSIMSMAAHFEQASKDAEGLRKLKLIIAQVGRFGGDDPRSEFGQVDIGNIARLLKANPLDRDSERIANDVLSRLQRSVLVSLNGPAHEGATGLSLFWPRNNQYLIGSNKYSEAFFNQDNTAWLDFVTSFVRLLRRRGE
ncbi:MAG: hypothetical protein KF812_08145 [Fimbriimonadaceae bacterium]|nr:hypothetical protein [Fimbriimonadaceae bacterium]